MRTRGVFWLLALALIISLTGCRPAVTTDNMHPAFSAQYIRTNGYHNGRSYPIVSVIKTKAELTAYYGKYKDEYDLERRENPASDYTIGFLDAVEQYDDAYFNSKLLILVLLEEGSGSNRHLVKEINKDEGNLNILIERQIPETGTADMAEWHVMVEVGKKDYLEEAIKVIFSVKNE